MACRYQKLRKKAGLTISDSVELYYDLKVSSCKSDILNSVFVEEADYFQTALGTPLLPISSKFVHGCVTLAREPQQVGSEDDMALFDSIITTESLRINVGAIRQVGMSLCGIEGIILNKTVPLLDVCIWGIVTGLAQPWALSIHSEQSSFNERPPLFLVHTSFVIGAH